MLYKTEFKDVSSKSLTSLREILFVSNIDNKLTSLLLFLETIASTVMYNLEHIIAKYAIFGWPTTKNLIIVKTAAFVALVVQRIFNTVMIVECVSTRAYTRTIIARVENTNQIAPCVKNFSSAQEVLPMKCRVVMLSIGNAFGSLQPTIPDALCVRKQQKLVNE